MIINYSKNKKEYKAVRTDKNGFKTIFGPYPSKKKMIKSIDEYAKLMNIKSYKLKRATK